MKKSMPLLLLLLALLLVFFACTSGLQSEETTAESEDTTDSGKTTSDADLSGQDGETTIGDDSASTLPEETTDGEEKTTEKSEETTVEPDDTNAFARIVFNPKIKANQYLSDPTQCTYSIETDAESGEGILKLETVSSTTNDPFVYLNYTKYCKKAECAAISVDAYPYVVIKLKAENCKGSLFQLYYCAGSVTGVQGDCVVTANFNNTDTEWQYVLFDLSNAAKWNGKLNGFRLDFLGNPAGGAGETVYISEILFLESVLDYYKLIGVDTEARAEETLSDEQKKRVEDLLGADDPAANDAASSYKKETAAFESEEIDLFFADMVQRIAQNDNQSTGNITYRLRLAKNEIEGCQAIIAASAAQTGLKVYLTDFKNESGDTLKTELFWGYYFDVEGENIIDPIVPVVYRETLADGALAWNNGDNHAGVVIPNLQKYDGFDIAAGQNQTFLIKAHTTANSPAGEYSATFTVVDGEGREIKKATVYAYVWDFTLPEETSCKTLMDLSWMNIYATHKCFFGDDSLLYKNYYDYLLENRVCAYTLPYSTEGTFSDSRINAYLDNPRVTAFQAVGWKVDVTEENVKSAYRYLSQKQEWLDKAYFYPIDEPNVDIDPNILNKINQYGKLLQDNFPGYKLIVPMHLNKAIGTGDYFTTVSEYVNVWCPHTFFFNTFAEYLANIKLTYRLTPQLEKQYGTFVERMQQEQNGGDEVWWYVTRFPQDPEITLTMNTAPINYRILFWQQKLYNVDGFLYYLANDWVTPIDTPDLTGLNAKHEVDASYPLNVYGNGVLVYCGQYFGEYGPVGSYRLEGVRDGIEDYEYLTMLTALYGEEDADLLIRQITTSLSRYTDDADYFLRVRNAIGNLIAAKSAE